MVTQEGDYCSSAVVLISGLLVCVPQVAELQLASRKRHQLASCEILQLPVKGRGDSLPVAGPAGLKETWAWLNKQLDELKVSGSSLHLSRTLCLV